MYKRPKKKYFLGVTLVKCKTCGIKRIGFLKKKPKAPCRCNPLSWELAGQWGFFK
jgi:hypothetical protein